MESQDQEDIGAWSSYRVRDDGVAVLEIVLSDADLVKAQVFPGRMTQDEGGKVVVELKEVDLGTVWVRVEECAEVLDEDVVRGVVEAILRSEEMI